MEAEILKDPMIAREQLEALLAVAREMASEPDCHKVLQKVAEQARRLVGAEFALVAVPGAEFFEPIAVAGRDSGYLSFTRFGADPDSPLGQGPAGQAFRSKAAAICSDTLSDQHFAPWRDEALRWGIRSNLVVPVLHGDKAVGILTASAREPGAFTQKEADLLLPLASQAGLIIQNAKLGQRVEDELLSADELRQRNRRELEVVLEAVRLVSSSLDLDTCLQSLAFMLARTLQAWACQVGIISDDGQNLVLKASYNVGREGLSPHLGASFPLGDIPQTDQIVGSLRMVEVDSPDSDLLTDGERARWQKQGLRVGLSLPLVVKGKAVGIVALADNRDKKFSETDKRLCWAIAQQASIAVENARLYGKVTEERERLEAIINNISDGVVILDSNLKVVTMNPALETISGWTTEEVVGYPCRNVFRTQDVHGGCLCDTACPMLQPLASGEPVPYLEVKIETKAGQVKDLSVSYSRLLATDGSVYGIVVARDISRVKEIEQLKEEFLSLISHDLRTPLTVIHLQAQMLRRLSKDGNSPRALQLAESILASADRLDSMIADLLEATRLETGQLELRKERVFVPQLVLSIVEQARTLGTGHLIRFERIDAVQILPLVEGDQERLERALMNIITNALKYSPSSSLVTVRVEGSDSGVTISVTDGGAGIAPEDLPYIFDRHYRARARKKSEGLGLGLYIAKMLVEAHGGQVWAESEKDKGSTFFVTLPKSKD